MERIDTVLESSDVILFENFTYQVIHLSCLSDLKAQKNMAGAEPRDFYLLGLV